MGNKKEKRGKRRSFVPYSEMTLREKASVCAIWIVIAFVFLVIVVPKKDEVVPVVQQTNPDLAFVGNIPTSTTQSNITKNWGYNTPEPFVTNRTQNTPIQTKSPSVTPIAMGVLTNTLVVTSTNIPTNTLALTTVATNIGENITATLTSIVPTVPMVTTTYYAKTNVNARSCPNTECSITIVVDAGDAVFAVEFVEGEAVVGNDSEWVKIQITARIHGFVYGQYLSETQIAIIPADNAQPSSNNNTSLPTPNAVINSSWNCSGDQYNCSDFGSGGSMTCGQLREYQSACPNDPSRLDNDNDNDWCESNC